MPTMKHPVQVLTLTLAIFAGVSCASKPGKLVEPPVTKPTPVAPEVGKIRPPLDKASDQNIEAHANTKVLLKEITGTKNALADAQAKLNEIQKAGSLDKLNYQALKGSWENIGTQFDKLRGYAKSLEAMLAAQAVELKAAKQALAAAMGHASTSDAVAREQAVYLQLAIRHAKAADNRNDKLLGEVAKAETKAAMYVKWLTILAAILIVYIGLRVCKLLPSFRPFLLWVP
jgi:hypothetical protein